MAAKSAPHGPRLALLQRVRKEAASRHGVSTPGAPLSEKVPWAPLKLTGLETLVLKGRGKNNYQVFVVIHLLQG